MKEKLEEPKKSDYGWHDREGFEDLDSGWVIEGGEDAYYEALRKWMVESYVPCCEVFDRMEINYMFTEDGRKCMPHLASYQDCFERLRVNYCPSCGKYVRDIVKN